MIVIRIPAKPKEEKRQKLRVAAYCRVSSAEPEQIASLESQVYYYERKIKSNKNWLYRGVYYDVGSGLRTEQRKGLAKMLRQAEKGRIDLILTKSVSRLARNTVDVLEATRMLKDKGVDIIFENENLKLSDQQTELYRLFHLLLTWSDICRYYLHDKNIWLALRHLNCIPSCLREMFLVCHSTR